MKYFRSDKFTEEVAHFVVVTNLDEEYYNHGGENVFPKGLRASWTQDTYNCCSTLSKSVPSSEQVNPAVQC